MHGSDTSWGHPDRDHARSPALCTGICFLQIQICLYFPSRDSHKPATLCAGCWSACREQRWCTIISILTHIWWKAQRWLLGYAWSGFSLPSRSASVFQKKPRIWKQGLFSEAQFTFFYHINSVSIKCHHHFSFLLFSKAYFQSHNIWNVDCQQWALILSIHLFRNPEVDSWNIAYSRTVN